MYHITKPFGRFVYNCRRRSAVRQLETKRTKVDVPVSKVPKKFNMTKKTVNESLLGDFFIEGRANAQQIRETSQGFLVSNTLYKIVATRASCPTHRKPAMRRETPIPNLKTVEMPMSKRTKDKETKTLIHVNSLLLAIGGGES